MRGYHAQQCTISLQSTWKAISQHLFVVHGSCGFVQKNCKNKKKTPHKIDVVPHAPRQLSKWGTAAHMTFHQPPHLPARGDQSGNPLYKGMYAVHVLNVLLVKIQCMECNI